MNAARRKPEDTDLRFDEAVAKLETIIDQIEAGEVGLEESLVQYEQGAKLIEHCRLILSRAEQRIAELTADHAGRLGVAGADASDVADADGDLDDADAALDEMDDEER